MSQVIALPRLELPLALRGVFFDFVWVKERVWELPTVASSCSLEELRWHLDLPVWSTDPPRPLFDLSPREVLNSPLEFPRHTARIESADLQFPLELFQNAGRWVILDGYHRLSRHVAMGSISVPVRYHPDEYLPRIS
jgi:hypothetical protein